MKLKYTVCCKLSIVLFVRFPLGWDSEFTIRKLKKSVTKSPKQTEKADLLTSLNDEEVVKMPIAY